MTARKSRWRGLAIRRLAQATFFLLFVLLLLRTEYRGSSVISWPVNAFFQADPFVGAAAALSSRAVQRLFWPALLTLAATLALGRFFCGWVCPLGSLLDFAGRSRRGAPAPRSAPAGGSRHLKYYLLAGALAAAAAGSQIAWFLDPFSLLARAFSVSVIPAANLLTTSAFDAVFEHARPVSVLTEPVYGVLREHVLTFDQQHFLWGGASLALLGLVLAGELVRPRLWCRHLCPLGGLLSLTARLSGFGRRVNDRCTDCGACYERCHLGLIDEANHRRSSAECTGCLICRDLCPQGAIGFGRGRRAPSSDPDLSRRRLIGGAAAGVAAVPLLRTSPAARVNPRDVLRPPGAGDERDFLRRCVRCGSCMKVCMGNAIHPALLEAGPEGLMTPLMHFRLGYCEYNCTLCGQVCPTGALQRLAPDAKRRWKVGEAFVDTARCLPWAAGVDCIVCEEHCPVPEKAIRLEEAEAVTPGGERVRVRRPRVVPELCIGCGICETKCPLQGKAAVVVDSRGQTRRWA